MLNAICAGIVLRPKHTTKIFDAQNAKAKKVLATMLMEFIQNFDVTR